MNYDRNEGNNEKFINNSSINHFFQFWIESLSRCYRLDGNVIALDLDLANIELDELKLLSDGSNYQFLSVDRLSFFKPKLTKVKLFGEKRPKIYFFNRKRPKIYSFNRKRPKINSTHWKRLKINSLDF